MIPNLWGLSLQHAVVAPVGVSVSLAEVHDLTMRFFSSFEQRICIFYKEVRLAETAVEGAETGSCDKAYVAEKVATIQRFIKTLDEQANALRSEIEQTVSSAATPTEPTITMSDDVVERLHLLQTLSSSIDESVTRLFEHVNRATQEKENIERLVKEPLELPQPFLGRV